MFKFVFTSHVARSYPPSPQGGEWNASTKTERPTKSPLLTVGGGNERSDPRGATGKLAATNYKNGAGEVIFLKGGGEEKNRQFLGWDASKHLLVHECNRDTQKGGKRREKRRNSQVKTIKNDSD